MNLICPNKSLFSKNILDTFKKKFKCRIQDLNQKQFDNLCHNYEIVLLRFTHKLKFKKKSKIKFIITPTTGLNHIDEKYFNSNVKIISLRGEYRFLSKINSTIEHTFYLLFNIIRQYPNKYKFGPKKNYKRYLSTELNDKTLGIVGMGRIGKKVRKIARSFGAKVVFYDTRNIPGKISLKNLLKISDIISFHINLSKKNYRLFDYKILSAIKEKSIILNTSRGEIFNQTDLLKILKEKKILFASDVLADENNENRTKNFLKDLKRLNINYFITPHVAGLSIESIYKTDKFIYKKFIKYIND